MRILFISVLLIIVNIFSAAQTKTEWFPAELNIQPFTANFLEPKVGFQYLFKIEKVRILVKNLFPSVQIFLLTPEHVLKLILNFL